MLTQHGTTLVLSAAALWSILVSLAQLARHGHRFSGASWVPWLERDVVALIWSGTGVRGSDDWSAALLIHTTIVWLGWAIAALAAKQLIWHGVQPE
jgi:hypothetical protein